MKNEEVELNESTEMNEYINDNRLEMNDEQIVLELLKDSDQEEEIPLEEKGMPEDISNFFIIFKRCGWLIALLILQSCSSWILSFFDDVCKNF
jgi:Mg/Co/Ni transporter MgtE